MKFDHPIAFLPGLARELGGIEEAIFYQQLHYWSSRGARDDGFVYKTSADLEEETTLTRRQQDRVRNKLIKNAWIEVKKTHAPNGAPTLHYRCLVEISICTKRTNPIVQKVQMDINKRYKSISTKGTNALYTENTTENTTSRKPPKGGKKFDPLGAEILKALEAVDPKNKNYYGNTTQRAACDFLLKEYGLDAVLKRISVLPKTNQLPYFPSIFTPVQLRDKWVQLQNAVDRKRGDIESKKVKII